MERGAASLRLALAALACVAALTAAPSAIAAAPTPRLELRRGERYIRVDGLPGFVLGRNPTETSPAAFEERFREAAAAGERLVRLHLMHGLPHGGRAGQVDEPWAARWEAVFDAAARHGIAVIPVFTVWAQWNDGSGGELWHVWHDNPYNAANGGPAGAPAELLADTECRRAWLRWLGSLVRRWSGRANILAWEPISELDLVTGSNPATARAFIEAAAAAVRGADRRRRPVTVSLSGIRDWPEVFGSSAVDIVQAHPYAIDPPYGGRLSDMLLDVTRARLARYGKPVLLGECGLDWRPPKGTLTLAARADVGVEQALWAAAVSGALSGRMLWWEDGYGKYESADTTARYRGIAGPVAHFVRGVSYARLRPTEALASEGVKCAALARADLVLAWARDARCDPPDWPERDVPPATIRVTVPGRAATWRVEFTDTRTGRVRDRARARSVAGRLVVPLPAFRGSIAFRAVRVR